MPTSVTGLTGRGQHPENLPGRVPVISGKNRKVLYSVHASR